MYVCIVCMCVLTLFEQTNERVIIRCGTSMVACQGRGKEFIKPWHLSLALKYNRNAPCTEHDTLPC